MTATISTKGQVTIPIAIRRKLGLRAGSRIEFGLCPEGAILRKRPPAVHPGDRWIGSVPLPSGATVDQLMEELRGPSLDRLPRRRPAAAAAKAAAR